MVLVRPVGTILPWAVAMMSTWPNVAQATAIAKNKMIRPAIALPAGDAGVSRISNAAGRNWRAVSSLTRFEPRGLRRITLGASADDMQPRLNLMKCRVAPGPFY